MVNMSKTMQGEDSVLSVDLIYIYWVINNVYVVLRLVFLISGKKLQGSKKVLMEMNRTDVFTSFTA